MTVITAAPTSSILEASLGFRAARWAPALQNIIHAGKVHNGWNACGNGEESFIILFFYRTAFDYRDTECQIKRPHARRSMSDLFQKQHCASFFLFICAVLSPAAVASLLHTDGFEFSRQTFRNSSAFSDTALVFVSSLTCWRVRQNW